MTAAQREERAAARLARAPRLLARAEAKRARKNAKRVEDAYRVQRGVLLGRVYVCEGDAYRQAHSELLTLRFLHKHAPALEGLADT